MVVRNLLLLVPLMALEGATPEGEAEPPNPPNVRP